MASKEGPGRKGPGEVINFDTEKLEVRNTPADVPTIFIEGMRGLTQTGGVVRMSLVDTITVDLESPPQHRHVINLAMTNDVFAAVVDHLKSIVDDMREKGLLK